MVSEEFTTGDLVWAKMRHYPPWPARIEQPPTNVKAPKNKKSHFVYFFGSENYAWIPNENISPHTQSFLDNISKKKSGAYQSAVEAFINYSKNNKKEKMTAPKSKKEKSVPEPEELEKEIVKRLMIPVKNRKRKVIIDKAIKKKVARKRHHEVWDGNKHECSYSKYSRRDSNEFLPVGSIQQNLTHSLYRNDIAKQYGSGNWLLQMKHVSPSSKKIGFIGLGHIGKGIVINLINSGHKVTLWNKTLHKCDDFIKLGAKRAYSAAELVTECDITFCCVSDPEASKSLIFGDRGILKGLELSEQLGMKNKGYVEMTSIDPETSQEIAEAVIMKNGRYLEAPICGDSDDAEKGILLILASGDRNLFSDCETCFHAMGRHAFYISCDVGFGTRMGLVLSMFAGTVYAAVAEALVLIERLKLPKEKFMEILQAGPFKCPNIVSKAKKMASRQFKPVNTPLKHVQKDLYLSLLLGNDFCQPMPVTAAANEVYNHARLLKYGDRDVSSVYNAILF